MRWTDNIVKDLRSCNVSDNDASNRGKCGEDTRKEKPNHQMGIIMVTRQGEALMHVLLRTITSTQF